MEISKSSRVAVERVVQSDICGCVVAGTPQVGSCLHAHCSFFGRTHEKDQSIDKFQNRKYYENVVNNCKKHEESRDNLRENAVQVS